MIPSNRSAQEHRIIEEDHAIRVVWILLISLREYAENRERFLQAIRGQIRGQISVTESNVISHTEYNCKTIETAKDLVKSFGAVELHGCEAKEFVGRLRIMVMKAAEDAVAGKVPCVDGRNLNEAVANFIGRNA